MMDVIELIEALKTADGETAMELVERLQCGKVDCSALSANGGALAATKSAEQVLADNGVFAGADGLRRFAECDTFWEDQMYGTRFYFSNELATDYIHRGVLRATVRALESGPANAPPSVTVPDGWSFKRLYSANGDAFGVRISSPREGGVRSSTSVWVDDEDMSHRMLALMLVGDNGDNRNTEEQ